MKNSGGDEWTVTLFSWHEISKYAMLHPEELFRFINKLGENSVFSRYSLVPEGDKIWVQCSLIPCFDGETFISFLDDWIRESHARMLSTRDSRKFIA